ncbi:DUF6760 family protein [Kitasatospora sp. NPDC091257]|uniref:DUF6760 family protein n=1 Tax=Kitasatospora sp. NPDC091257 TaxID=3364084 RepID=UPI0037F4CA9B
MRRSARRTREEIAYLAHHFHWSYADLVGLTHGERRSWVAEAVRINTSATGRGAPPWGG